MKETKPEFSRGDLTLDNEGAYFLYQAAGWARFLAILGLALCGMIVLMFLIGVIVMSGAAVPTYGVPEVYDPAIIFTWPVFIFMLVLVGIVCIPLIYLYNFSDKTRKAFKAGESHVLAKALRSLKNLFVFYGIVIMIYILLFLLSAIVGIRWETM